MIKKPSLLPIDEIEMFGSSALVAGVDEVGRGALFGPVFASAVILPQSAFEELRVLGVKDSKQLSGKRRTELAQKIQAIAVGWQVGYATSAEIDEINIFQASLLAMTRAVQKLEPQPTVCLVDGKFALPKLNLPQHNLIKGDQRSLSIAAASIVAKVWRDQLVVRLANKYTEYDLVANKGYGTQKHRLAIAKYGCTPQHRLSFAPCRQTMSKS